MKKVLTYGTYDLLHRGHINLLKRAKEMGDYLIVGLSTDDFNQLKDKKSFYSYEERKLVLEAVKNSCCSAALTVIRFEGSNIKHLVKSSVKYECFAKRGEGTGQVRV